MENIPIISTTDKQKLKPRTVALVIALILVIVGGAIVVIHNHNKPAPHVAKNTGPGRFAGIDAQAKNKLDLQKVYLETYGANHNGHYPAELTPDVFANQKGVAGDISSTLTPPAGYKFVYAGLPKGCTTAANDCSVFTLDAVNSKGKIVYTVTTVKITPPPAGAKIPPPKT